MGFCAWFSKTKNKGDRLKQVEQKKNAGKESRVLPGVAGDLNMPVKDIAAIRIQTVFRAYMARKALRRLKGTVRFKALIDAHVVAKQASSALDCIHFWSKMQTEVRARRHSMVNEGRTRQKKLENQLKVDAKLHELEEEWCGGSDSIEEVLSKIQQREEATIKRERAMAYAFSHQWKANTNRYFGQAYYNLSKESWGWSWVERWIAVCPWETRVIPKKLQTGRQVSKLSKTRKPKIKILLSVKPHLENGKDTKKAIHCS